VRTFSALIETRCRERGDAVFLRTHAEAMTYAELEAQTAAFAQNLILRGVRPGDHVLLLMRNRLEFVIAWFAVLRANAVIVPLNTELIGDHLDYLVARSDAATLIGDAGLVAAIGSQPDQIRLLITDDPVEPRSFPLAQPVLLAELVRAPDQPPELPVGRPDDPCQLMFSSGTTGRPKGVLRYQEAELAKATLSDPCGLTAADVLYCNVPLFHGLGLNWIQMALWAGGSAAIVPRFSRSQFASDVREFGATAVPHVGSMVSALLQLPAEAADQESGLRVSFGVGVPASLWREYEQRYGLSVVEFYGSTETGLVAFNPPGGPVGSIGRPVDQVEVRLLSPAGKPSPAGTPGEMVFRYRSATRPLPSYYDDPAATAERLDDGWWRTGDLVRADDEGFLYYCGRIRDTIRHRGENIVPDDIERTVTAHPAVAAAAAVAMPGELGGDDDVRLFVVPAGEATIDTGALRSWLVERLPRYMLPAVIEIIPQLPMTATHKVQREELRRRPHSVGAPNPAAPSRAVSASPADGATLRGC
jgi:crotonobetaine/carnitine-CoA ligase